MVSLSNLIASPQAQGLHPLRLASLVCTLFLLASTAPDNTAHALCLPCEVGGPIPRAFSPYDEQYAQKPVRERFNLRAPLSRRNMIISGLLNRHGASSEGQEDHALYERTVWSPPIIEPFTDTNWIVGSRVDVVWDTSNRPSHATSDNGKLILGYLNDGDSNEHLDMEHPLADNFSLLDGNISIIVPNVEPKSNYIAVLLGDSGNKSPKFTISG